MLCQFDELRPLLLEAGRLITAKEAERRVLVLENSGLRGTSQITQSLYAGLQVIIPGEIARTHKHMAALSLRALWPRRIFDVVSGSLRAGANSDSRADAWPSRRVKDPLAR
jgi:gentisate 1,2-dioxygenase